MRRVIKQASEIQAIADIEAIEVDWNRINVNKYLFVTFDSYTQKWLINGGMKPMSREEVFEFVQGAIAA